MNSSKLTPGTEHLDRLKLAFDAMSAVAVHINEATRFTDALAAELSSNIPDFHLTAHMSMAYLKRT